MTGSLARDSRRTPLCGSAFIRLLAALADVPAPASKDAFAERLSRWFDWTDAISLSAALDAASARTSGDASTARLFASADEREFARVRTALAKAVAEPRAARADAARFGGPASAPDAGDFEPHRERCLARQQAMEAGIAALRRRVRATLAGGSPAMARLAALDAVMEEVVGAREQALLSSVPRWLEQHFERLRRADAEAAASPGFPGARPAGEWLDVFRRDMRDLLLAELDFRLQPVEGLLEALRGSSTDHHE